MSPPRLMSIVLVSIAAQGRGLSAQDAGGSRAPLELQLRSVFRTALKRVTPSVVRIDTIGGAPRVVRQINRKQEQRVAPSFRQADGPTTGVIWSADGFIVTSSFNFINDPMIITVTLSDGRRFVADLVARDTAARLALLKIDAEGLPAPRWRARQELRRGQWVLTAGFGRGSTAPALSTGVISALDRMSAVAIQTDAKISPANYGGPLFDIEGRVVGVCVPMGPGENEIAGVQWYDSGIGFAVSTNQLRIRLSKMEDGRDLHRGVLGVLVDTRAPVVGHPDEDAGDPVDGVRITDVPPGPARQAGLEVGDVVTSIDGKPTPRLVDFRRALAARTAGDVVTVASLRDKQPRETRIRLASVDDVRAAATSQAASAPAAP